MRVVVVLAVVVAAVAAPAAAKRADRDHDGLSDRHERRQSHTSPRKADTDRDGLSDGAEVRRYHTNPRREDTDGDGLTDGDEVDPNGALGGQLRRYGGALWSDPRKRDTDGDRLTDRGERIVGSNPGIRDTDGDGLADGYEVKRLGTNPLSGDTDGDGLSDGMEAMLGTNARDAASPGKASPAPEPGPAPDPTPSTPTTTTKQPVSSDGKPPQTSISSGPSGTVTATTATFAFKSNESSSTFQCRLDGNSWVGCTSPRAVSGLANGTHTFDVRAIDAAGNVDPTPASRTWQVQAEQQQPPPPAPDPEPEPEPEPTPGPGDGCTTIATTVAQAQSAVSAAAAGAVVCLANGSYGAVKLTATKSAPGVILRAQSAGGATIGSVDLSGRGLTLQGFVVAGDVTIAAKSSDMSVLSNDITSGGLALFLYGDGGQISNVRIAGNRISGMGSAVTGENDVVRLHNYRNVVIEDNELRNVYESGGHSDILQSVHGGAGLVIRRNYVHDQGGTQGFFIKDGALTNLTIEDNLIVDDPKANGYAISFYDTSANPSDPLYTGYGAVVRRNTVWNDSSGIAIRGQNTTVLLENNVTTALLKESGTVTSANNVIGGKPVFVDAAGGDYRLQDGSAGVTWTPIGKHFGP